MAKEINFYTDGGSRGNPGIGGWGVYCPEFDLHICGYKDLTTNNEMELMAVYQVFKFMLPQTISSLNLGEVDTINIYSDSQYVVGIFTQWVWNWLKNDQLRSKKNSALISDILLLREGLINDEWSIKFHKVAGHADCDGNIEADRLVNLAMDTKTDILPTYQLGDINKIRILELYNESDKASKSKSTDNVFEVHHYWGKPEVDIKLKRVGDVYKFKVLIKSHRNEEL